MPGNEDILNVYTAVRSQVRTAGMDGTVIDLDHNAMWTYMEKYGIENQLDVFEKVIGLFHHFLAEDATTKKLTTMERK